MTEIGVHAPVVEVLLGPEERRAALDQVVPELPEPVAGQPGGRDGVGDDDALCGAVDNCPLHDNVDQTDGDADGVGELGGRGLIKNAVNEGKVAVEHVARLRRADAADAPSDDAPLDLIVVGSGAAGGRKRTFISRSAARLRR